MEKDEILQTIKIGDIYVQHNFGTLTIFTFFKVVKKTPHGVRLQRLKKKQLNDNLIHLIVVPTEEVEEEKTYRLTKDGCVRMPFKQLLILEPAYKYDPNKVYAEYWID